ncbi:hypothetical protein sync_0885 [Synechococcus sp. CC9311]|nr:hypothetical protein sync_0885 [Synechococcus sp. CC9311]
MYDISTLSLPPENEHVNGTVPENVVESSKTAEPTLASKANIEHMIDKTIPPLLGDITCEQYVKTS